MAICLLILFSLAGKTVVVGESKRMDQFLSIGLLH